MSAPAASSVAAMTAREEPPAALPPREAYRLWAPVYEGETAVSYLDDLLVSALTPSVRGKRVLDAGCGTGRRLRGMTGAALRAGTDLTWEMLAAGALRRDTSSGDAGDAEDWGDADGAAPAWAAADVRALPFAPAAFDLVWCRLVIGHLPSLATAYGELARVCRVGGTVIVTDFHPDAARAGHTRAFRDAAGRLHHVEHHVHAPGDHARAAAAAGLDLVETRDGVVGDEIRPFYARAGRLDRYAADAGLPVVLALAFRRRIDG